MKKFMCIALAAMMVIMAGSSAGYAFRGGGGHGGHGGHGGYGWRGGHGWHGWHGGYGGAGVWIGSGWGWPYYPYYSYPYYSAPPVVIEEQPDTYIQQVPPAGEATYWYFCREPEGYYPYVRKCPKGWLKVVPPSTPEDGEE